LLKADKATAPMGVVFTTDDNVVHPTKETIVLPDPGPSIKGRTWPYFLLTMKTTTGAKDYQVVRKVLRSCPTILSYYPLLRFISKSMACSKLISP
jgi:hypothetical protein